MRLTALDELSERRAPDRVLGLAPDDYPPQYRRWRKQRAAHPYLALPGGESLADFTERADRACRTVDQLACDASGLLVAVSHRVLIGAVVALHEGVTEPDAVFTAASAFPLEPAALWPVR
ncbi:MAG: histidine phosphatase family protein [Pseudonocardiaceae bacterium]